MSMVSLTATLVLATAFSAFGQTPVVSTSTPLSQLLAEAGADNPQISAAAHGARAARQMAPQVTPLPDPKFTYQQLSVGSPKPFAGYTNSDFAYIGVGASQELPYPGKLRARGEVAERDADTKQAEVEVTKTSIADAVKADYLQLAYLQQTLGILRLNESVLDQLIEDAAAHYQVGQGMQQDVLQAQVNRTKIVKEITMQYVRKGEPLFTIYSPDVVATQQEYLLARQNQKTLGASTVDGVASGAELLSAAAEQRLEQWEVPQSEIVKLKETGKPVTDLTINSPVEGYITERNALPNMYAEPSTKLYTVADLSRVWVYAQVFQDDIGRVKPGDTAQITVDSYPGRAFSGQIEEILPQVDIATRTVRVRLAMANPRLKLKPGMFVNVDLKANLGRQLVVPASAVFQSGIRQLVFLNHGNGSLEPKEVTIGPRVGDDFVVLKGLKAHESIVTSASFLIDSESQLQAAAGSFVPPSSGFGGNTAATNTPATTQANIDFTPDPNPPQKGSNVFRVKLTGADGKPTTGAAVSVTFYMAGMPAMGMAAMTTTTNLTDKGNGMYEGSGSLGSGGTYQVTISAQKSGLSIATKQLRVNVTGGM